MVSKKLTLLRRLDPLPHSRDSQTEYIEIKKYTSCNVLYAMGVYSCVSTFLEKQQIFLTDVSILSLDKTPHLSIRIVILITLGK